MSELSCSGRSWVGFSLLRGTSTSVFYFCLSHSLTHTNKHVPVHFSLDFSLCGKRGVHWMR